MQGWAHQIPTQAKIDYLQQLLKVGFHTLDCGSFVSAKAIPQMADTRDVISRLNISGSDTKLLTIVANERGAADAVAFDNITYLGFPFSISETFQQRNTNSSIDESLYRVEAIQKLCTKHKKELVVYISMGFGNPYGDPYNEEIVYRWVERLIQFDIKIISLADTVGLASAQQVFAITKNLVQALPQTEIGVHLHSTAINWKEKLDAAWQAGCKRFDGALKGIGGCPMADDDLVGNMDTELMIPYFQGKGALKNIDQDALNKSLEMASRIFI